MAPFKNGGNRENFFILATCRASARGETPQIHNFSYICISVICMHYKPLFVALALFLYLANKAHAQSIRWEQATYKFKTAKEGEKVVHTFHFRNVGKEPLLMTHVAVSCGCTTPKSWPKDPIRPGKKGFITISFDTSGKSGHQRKIATVISNATEGDAEISMEGDVLPRHNTVAAPFEKR